MSCKIQLSSIPEVGSSFNGKVICQIPNAIRTREIRCVLKGREKTRFKQGKNTVTGLHEFLLAKQVLYDKDSIEPGTYEFPFEFYLPPDLPNSVERDSGSIRYSLTATVDIPFDFDYEEKIRMEFTHPVDLNLQHGVLLGNITYEWQETISCLCFDTGNATMKVTLEERNAYLPGELLKMFVEVKNFTSYNIERLDVTLTRVTTFKSDRGSSRRQRVPLSNQTYNGVGSNSENTYSIDFRIPQAILPSNFFRCTIIEEVYRLRVCGVYPPLYDDLIVDINLIIGVIPLRSVAVDGATILGN
ncbi:unnamed protein product [Psylliodes chrysocephalus]|uniref:Arrestin C-terminal-like domain-containing protein n=1 Tax=Psylliodes chrysocephalus TaxID=3402493 RepID=A0A9P0GFQ5_9CUCU|nr:unnamed protein product [Psylliodes chrysocephala]